MKDWIGFRVKEKVFEMKMEEFLREKRNGRCIYIAVWWLLLISAVDLRVFDVKGICCFLWTKKFQIRQYQGERCISFLGNFLIFYIVLLEQF